MTRRLAKLALLRFGVVLAAVLQTGAVLSAAPSEYEVKAAFILNFTRFIQWPAPAAGAGSPFTICILGEDPFGRIIDDTMAGESVSNRPIVVRRMRQHSPGGCEVLFVSKGESDGSRSVVETGPGVLTIGDSPDFLQKGGVIAFALENRRVRFDVNQTAAARASLQISSKLLTVARAVEK